MHHHRATRVPRNHCFWWPWLQDWESSLGRSELWWTVRSWFFLTLPPSARVLCSPNLFSAHKRSGPGSYFKLHSEAQLFSKEIARRWTAEAPATCRVFHLCDLCRKIQGETQLCHGPIIDDLQNYCLGACNGANRHCQVRCHAMPATHMPKTGQGDSVHPNFDCRKLMTLNNRRSVVVLPIFTPNTKEKKERPCFILNENVLVLKMKQGTVKWQGFKVGQCFGLAAPVRERYVNVGRRWTSVIPSLNVWYSKLKYPSREDASNNVLNLKIWKKMTPVGTFFRSNAELTSSFNCHDQLYRRRIGGQLTLV